MLEKHTEKNPSLIKTSSSRFALINTVVSRPITYVVVSCKPMLLPIITDSIYKKKLDHFELLLVLLLCLPLLTFNEALIRTPMKNKIERHINN